MGHHGVRGQGGLGLTGGAACSGGQACTGTNGFSVRPIWRSGGQAAVYYYSLNHSGQYGDYLVLKDPAGTDRRWKRGAWVQFALHVRVNTVTDGVANPDGRIETWFDGVPAGQVDGVRFVTNGDLVDTAYFSSFAGGSTPEFAPRVDSYVWYDDLKVSTSASAICEISASC